MYGGNSKTGADVRDVLWRQQGIGPLTMIPIVRECRARDTVLPRGINTMQSQDWHFPMACPSCAAPAGTPYRATAEKDAIRVSLRCSNCAHSWESTGPAASPLMLVKPDRRRASDREPAAV